MTIYYKINALRQLYQLSTHPSVQVDRWLATNPDREPQPSSTMVIPQLSLHTTGGPFIDIMPYGRQAVAQVYGTITATQEIFDSAATGPGSYPWVRFYARRFGTTTVPLKLTSPTITGSSVSLTPAAWDELEEIVDGWKEITLEFDNPPTMGSGSNTQWVWSAAGELASNRWEVLGACAPALSGIPGNIINRAPSPHQLSLSTYGAPVSGANINLGWVPGYSPMVSATTDDQTSDAVILFGQELPIITGFGVSEQNQSVVGIGMDCGLDPCCIPSEIAYHEVSWGLPANTGVASDDFDRTVAAGGWGSPTVGGAYTLSLPLTDWSVNGSRGVLTFTNVGSHMAALLNTGSVNFDVQADITYPTLPATNLYRAGVVGRADASFANAYFAQIRVNSFGNVALNLDKRVSGSDSTLVALQVPSLSMGPEGTLTVRLVGYGSTLKAKIWRTDEDQPLPWTIETTDTSLVTGSYAGLVSMDETAVSGHSFQFDNLIIGPPGYFFGYYELQRMDTVTTEWQTIMKASDPSVTNFNDYEARVGILSSYRIRAVDVHGFPGVWSATVTGMISEPGVTIGCQGGHLLIFTSNEEQDGSINLAYSSVWESGDVEEAFAFPEAAFVQLQTMYNRDFFVAFRPTERGGEQFSRTVLVQAAAIAPETLGDFTSLRDMAWANVSYICVRDEDGNRWFATVLVPSGRVLRDRRLYLAPVEIIEVTDTPSEVDP